MDTDKKETGFRKFINWMFGGNLRRTVTDPASVGAKPSTDSSNNPLESVINKYTGTGLTGAEREQNEWTAQREDTQAQRQVKDLMKAGLNPALMYQNGAGGDYASASAGGVAGSGSLQELVTVMTLPLQLEQMRANIVATKENTNSTKLQQKKIIEETRNLQATYNEILSRTDLTDSQREMLVSQSQYIDRQLEAQLRKTEAETALTAAQKRRVDELLAGEKLLQSREAENYLRGWEELKERIKKYAAEIKLSERDLEDYALNRLNTGIVQDIFRAWRESKLDKDGDGKRDE